MQKARKLPKMLPVATRLLPDKLKRIKAICWKKKITIGRMLQEAADLWLDRELERD